MTTTTSGRAAATVSHVVCSELLAGEAEHVGAAGELDELRRPVPGDEHRVQPLERGDGRPRSASRTASRTASMRARWRVTRSSAASRAPVAWATVRMSPIASPSVVRVERDDLRVARDPARDGDDVVVGDGAHGAQLLGDDQVGLELGQGLLVELVDRLAALRALAHRGVDLGRAQAAAGARRA